MTYPNEEDQSMIPPPADTPPETPARVTKDSGKREEYNSGMVRDTEKGKARFDLLLPLGVPYEEQFWTRVAELLARGAEKYDARNWEKANSEDELARYKSSALRHLQQWASGETDEDHAAAVVFNLMAAETLRYKLKENNASSKENSNSSEEGNPGKIYKFDQIYINGKLAHACKDCGGFHTV